MPVLFLDLHSFAIEALSIQSDNFIEIVEKVTSLMQKENGRVSNMTITGHLVKLEPTGEALIVGDLHGDFDSLMLILQKSNFIEKMEKAKDATLIFLGDYGDRGDKSVDVYYLILKLKLAYPKQVILLRGNHEAPGDLLGGSP